MSQNANIPEYISRTQATLGSIVRDPELTRDLLQRPPFRFIFDIFMSVHLSTGFGSKLVPSENNEYFVPNDKQSRLKFVRELKALIFDELEVEDSSVSESKILAGLEPERTNFLLVCLYDAVMKHIRKVTSRKGVEMDPCRCDEREITPKLLFSRLRDEVNQLIGHVSEVVRAVSQLEHSRSALGDEERNVMLEITFLTEQFKNRMAHSK
jgi:hypothetical protein